MLDKKISEIAGDWVEGALASRTTSFQRQIDAKQNQLAARGMFRSGAAIREFADIANEELRTFAATIWTALTNSLNAMPPAPSAVLGDEVLNVFEEMFSARYKAMLSFLAPVFVNSADPGGRGIELVNTTYNALMTQYSAHVRLWAGVHERKSVGSSPPPASYVFNGPVGSVQTGAGSIANVVQKLNATDLAPLLKAVRDLEFDLQGIRDIDPLRRDQGIDLNKKIEQELVTAEPNVLVLQGLLSGLSSFVQGLASAPAAYSVLQACSQALGLM